MAVNVGRVGPLLASRQFRTYHFNLIEYVAELWEQKEHIRWKSEGTSEWPFCVSLLLMINFRNMFSSEYHLKSFANLNKQIVTIMTIITVTICMHACMYACIPVYMYVCMYSIPVSMDVYAADLKNELIDRIFFCIFCD